MTDPTTLCPFLTAAVLARPRQLDVPRINLIGSAPGAQPTAEPEAVACQGKQCMLYVTQTDPGTGKEVGGRCAITMGVVALGMLNETVARFTADPSKKN